MGQASKGKRESIPNNFDAMRLGLALLVVFSHSFPLLGWVHAKEPVARMTGGQTTGGALAVSGFFLLSGFLITQSWERCAGLLDYLRRRILRIYPGFIVAYAICALLVGPLASGDALGYLRSLRPYWMIFDILILGDEALPRAFTGQPFTSLNGSLWTIHYEFVCYLGAAGLGLIGAFRRRWLTLLAFVAAYGCYSAQVYLGYEIPTFKGSWLLGSFRSWPRLGSAFLAGSLFHLYRDAVRYTARGAAAASLCLVLLAAIPKLISFSLAVPLLGGYTFFWAGNRSIPALREFGRRADLSYGVYLYGWPVQQSLVALLANRLQPWSLFLVAAPLAASCAALSWFLVEKPSLRFRTRPVLGATKTLLGTDASPGKASGSVDFFPAEDPASAGNSACLYH